MKGQTSREPVAELRGKTLACVWCKHAAAKWSLVQGHVFPIVLKLLPHAFKNAIIRSIIFEFKKSNKWYVN